MPCHKCDHTYHIHTTKIIRPKKQNSVYCDYLESITYDIKKFTQLWNWDPYLCILISHDFLSWSSLQGKTHKASSLDKELRECWELKLFPRKEHTNWSSSATWSAQTTYIWIEQIVFISLGINKYTSHIYATIKKKEAMNFNDARGYKGGFERGKDYFIISVN